MHDRQRHHGPPHDLLVLRAFAHALVGVPTMTQTSLVIAACFIKGYRETKHTLWSWIALSHALHAQLVGDHTHAHRWKIDLQQPVLVKKLAEEFGRNS